MGIATPVLAGDGLMPIAKSAPFAVNFHSDDFGGAIGNLNQELKAAPGVGKATYISHVTMGVVSSARSNYVIDSRLTIIDGAGAGADFVFGPIQFEAQGESVMSKDFDPPLKITDNTALGLTGVGSGGSYYSACVVYIEGFTGQKPI